MKKIKPEIFRIFQINYNSILIEWSNQPSKMLLNYLLAFKKKLLKEPEISICVIGYNSLLVNLEERIESFNFWIKHFKKIYSKVQIKKIKKGTFWKIPVCYDEKFAPDIVSVSKFLNLSTQELIKLHSKPKYLVYFIGFLPGFLYLHGLDNKLHFPRKEKPILNVPKGSVAIGGEQTGIYPRSSPGGWHLIGRTPISLFEVKNNPPTFIKPGDLISFIPVELKAYLKIERDINSSNFNLKLYD